MTDRRIVLVAGMYHPDPRVGAVRPQKVVRALTQAGWTVDVVTAGATESVDTGDSGETVHRVVPNITLRDRLFGVRGEAGQPAEPPRASRRSWLPTIVRDTLLAPLVVPDLERGLIGPVAERARELLDKGPAILYSTSPPHSVAIAARRALRELPHPWIAEFRDPWTNPGHRAGELRPWLWRTIDTLLERSVLRRVNRVVGVSDGIASWLRERWSGDGEVVISRNGVDTVYSHDPTDLDTIVYLGELYLGRDPRPFFRALGEALDTRPERATRCRMIGDVNTFWGESTAAMASEAGIAHRVTFEERVGRDEAIAIQCNAGLLLLLAQQQPLQVPNKLYEYLATRRPILAFVDDDGESAKILRDVGGHFIISELTPPADIPHIIQAALDAAGSGEPVGSQAGVAKLSTASQMAQVVALLDDVWSRHYGRP